ncbi:MAG: Ig-like domain-containing protein, partial [Acidobacteriota bacterium]|nr:Ig-like domain-containing protein [Acidobacteriota bacterium]
FSSAGHAQQADDAEGARVAVQTADGQTYTVAQTPGGTTAVVGGAPGVTTFVREGDGVAVQGAPAGDTSAKIDDRLKKLKSGGDDSETPVIIRFNLSFRQFYDGSNGNASARAQKRREFDDAKSRLNAVLNGRGRLKGDLLVVNGVAAGVKPSALDALEADPSIAKVEPDVVDHVTLDTSVDEIGARTVWSFSDGYNNSMTGVGRRIAIIDTGVDYTHPDLGGCLGPGCKVVGGWNFLTNTPDPMDDYGHGTHVAAIAAGNGLLRGVAPDASIIAYKVCNSSGSCYSSDIIAALGYAADPNHDGDQSDHVDVASMSLGGGGNPDDSQSLAVDNATSAGVVVTVAAGNAGPGAGTIQSPGTARTAITVAAACKSAQVGTNSYCGTPVASFSSRGPLVWGGQDLQKPDVAAPGVLICAARWANAFAGSPTCFDNQHIRISGTSMATPHVAGAAALIRQAFPTYTPDQVKQLLKNTARDLGRPYDEQGAGEINVLAAIPGSSKIVATPNSWEASTDPSVKTTRLDDDFMVTPVDHSISTLDVSANLNVPGVTFAFGKTTLNVAGGATDGFHATIYVDNDVAHAGTYQGSIVLSEGGQSKGVIPVTLHVAPTIRISPSPIDFGTDNPSLPNWTSTQSITVTNFRADTSQTVTLTPPTFPAAVTFSAPATITVAPNSAYTFNASVTANNSTLANGSYAGQLAVSNATTSASVTAKFIKFYTLTISDASGGIVGSFALVHNRVNTQSTFTVTASQTTLYEDTAGPYDVIIYYPRTTDAVGGHDYVVFKEGVDLSSGSATVNTSRADASLQTKMIATDPSGVALSQIGQRASSDRYLNTGLGVLRLNSGADTTTNYFSPVSTSYTHHEEYETMKQAAPVLDFYYGRFTGLSADRTFTNSATDFKTLRINTDPNGASGQALPVVFTCLPGGNNCFALYYNTSTLAMPVAQTIRSLLPTGAYQYQSSDVLRTGCPASGPCPSQYSTAFLDLASQARKANPADAANYPTWQSGTVYNGLGPSIWAAKFANTSGNVRVVPYYSTNAPVLFLRQDYSLQEYANTPYTLTGPTSTTGTLYGSGVGTWSALPSLGVQAGAYQFDVASFNYYDRGVSLNARVHASFNTTLADPNPPALTQLTYTTNGVPSDAHDSAANNQLYFAFDAVGGTLSQATAAFSGDGTSFTPIPAAPSGAGYVANVPAVPFTKLTLRITGTDSSGNSLQYTFELPALNPISDTQPPTTSITSPANNQTVNGVVPVQVSAQDDFGVGSVELYLDGALLGTSTSAPYTFNWNTDASAEGAHTLTSKAYDLSGNAGTSSAVTVTVKHDVTPPTVGITSPANGAAVLGTVAVQVSATDNVGVTQVELYRDAVLIGTKTAAPYTFNWDTTTVANGTHTLTAKAYDADANSVTSAAVSVNVQNDFVAPAASIASPTAGQTVSATVTVQVSASDNVGVTRVELYADGGLVGTKTAAPYAFSWNTDPLAETTHTLQAKAYDAANNVGTSSPVSVTVKHDVTPPTVSLTAPAAGSTLAGTVTVSANASDDKGVARVEFYKGATLIGTDTTAPYSVQWNTSAEAPGAYTLTARAYDTGGNSTTSAGVNVTVKDSVAPTVSITSPANNSTVAKKTTVTISATASDNVGVTKVEFYVGGVLTCTDTTAPFTCAWPVPATPGKVYTLTAKGYDAAGNAGASASVTVTSK